ncbi:DUF3426 domain-containing protein [Crenobacter cavernae]|uniref:DUF3426 domain-containing protein n=1 Tax=Crenobacter cavernae TaxID=2290923 RepID=A0A345Y338_9NEIS|nr:DUF3426 domain-containing protein [Crenobacter cavernae]AXK38340.1 DUF3426 domain-containing protein [Crenobacter cavernae]
MSYATQCPSCQTRFKVTDAQLAIAEGLVRCGRCAHVFNAREALEAQTEPPTELAPPPPPPRASDDFELELPDFDPIGRSPIDEKAPAEQAEIESPEPEFEAAPAAEPEAAAEVPSTDPRPSPDDDVGVFEQALKDALSNRREPVSARVEAEPPPQTASEAPIEDLTAAATPEAPIAEEAMAAALPARDEAQTAEDDKEDNKGLDRGVLLTLIFTLLGILGLIALLAQLVYFNRTRIAAEVPELRPALEAACSRIGCDVPWPGDAEYIRTEWSELAFVPEHANLIQVSATLKNHARYPQAFPAMELTLKDNDDQVLVRRSFAASDYLKPDDFKQGHLAGNSEVKITMRLDTGKLKPLGYSIFWFYP